MRRKRIQNYIRHHRKSRGLTQKQVASILGLESSSMISRWERGVCFADTLNALRMAIIYGTTVDFLYEDARLAMLDELSQRADVVTKAGVEYHG